ncbi:MAG: SDR family NAD(P)-dependent oxidoreductase, partial [Actinobacteria bacterium]|nr:SDR family NAD(P)-dependent oxidoreductase [Actinomycetota bacterium]
MNRCGDDGCHYDDGRRGDDSACAVNDKASTHHHDVKHSVTARWRVTDDSEPVRHDKRHSSRRQCELHERSPWPVDEVLPADLVTAAGVDAVLARLRDTTRAPIDLVVNNAGFGTSGAFADADPERLSREISLNVSALTRIAHEAVRQMQTRGHGYLLNVSSIASFQPGPGLAVYSATKAFVTSLTEALHEELRGSGVRVTALCPGLTHTEFQSISNTTGLESKFPDFA